MKQADVVKIVDILRTLPSSTKWEPGFDSTYATGLRNVPDALGPLTIRLAQDCGTFRPTVGELKLRLVKAIDPQPDVDAAWIDVVARAAATCLYICVERPVMRYDATVGAEVEVRKQDVYVPKLSWKPRPWPTDWFRDTVHDMGGPAYIMAAGTEKEAAGDIFRRRYAARLERHYERRVLQIDEADRTKLIEQARGKMAGLLGSNLPSLDSTSAPEGGIIEERYE